MIAGCSAVSAPSTSPVAVNGAAGKPGVERYQCYRVRSHTDLIGLRGEWNAIHGDRTQPFQRWEWLENWWRFYSSPQRQLFTLVVRAEQAGRTVALLPMYLDTSSVRGRVLRFLGDGEVCTDYNTLLIREGYQQDAVVLLAHALANDFAGSFDSIELESILTNDSHLAMLAEALAGHGFRVYRQAAHSSWRTRLDGDWDGYLSRLSRSRRWRARNIQREYFESARTRVIVATDDVSFHHGFEIFVELHQRRRESLGDEGCFASSQFHAFLRSAGSDLLAADCLELQWLELEGKPIAAEFDLRGRDVTYLYQSGIDPDAEAERPGWQAVMTSLRRTCDRGARAFDFLRGDEPYKTSWGAEEVPQENVTLVPPRLGARIRHLTTDSLIQLRKSVGTLAHRFRPRH